jgi:glycosidase
MIVRRSLRVRGFTGFVLLFIAGCGGGGSIQPPPPGFTLSASPNSVLVAQTTTSGSVTLTATPTNGFTGTISVTISGLPPGVTPSSGSSFTLSAGASQPVTFAVGASVPRGNYAVNFSGSSGSVSSSASVALTVSGTPLSSATGNFKQQVIYQIVTDRFFNGDTSNDDPALSPGLFDSTRTNYQAYWGGDFAGIQQKMAYLAGMGVTAIWISPPVDNIDVSTTAAPIHAPFHGYWAHDMMCLEEHFGNVTNPCDWTPFDNMVAAAHQNGIRVIVDFAANDTNPFDAGESGVLLSKGQPFASFQTDPNNFFHHSPTITDFTDPYQLQYYTLVDLADLNQDNPSVDSYLKSALLQFMNHGVDAFRLDAVKHVTWGWEYSLANAAFTSTSGPTFLFGEWFQGGFQGGADPRYPDSHKFANHSGISLLDFPLAFAFRDVFGNPTGGDFHEIDNTLTAEAADFLSPNDLVTFFDSHDLPRLLSMNSSVSQNRVNEALALLLACRGIPVVLYGDEQYLHNDTNGGNDPYNRIWMSSFNTQTTAYSLINLMANLRQSNPALAYGTSMQRWINNDVYILERQFNSDIVLIAVNKSETTPYNITGLLTALPAGNYSDYLNGLISGFSITVSNAGGNNPVTPFMLNPHTVSVWQLAPAATPPQVGSIGPRIGQSGVTATMGGQGFGSSQGQIKFGMSAANIKSWSDSNVTFSVPAVAPGIYQVQLVTGMGGNANTVPFTVLTGPLIPVTFTVNNVPTLASGSAVYLTGNVVELGNNATTADAAVGPLLQPPNANPATTWFIDASVPAGQLTQFKFFKLDSSGTVTAMESASHPYTVPPSGVGSVAVTWIP